MNLRNYTLALLCLIGCTWQGYAQNCSGPLSVTVIGAETNQPIVIDEESSNIYCTENSEGEIFLTVYGGTPKYTCNWAHDTITSDYLTDLPIGSYQVTVSDQNGCSEERTITIFHMDPLLDSLDLIQYSACGDCYLHDGTQSFFYFEDEYIGAIIDIDTDKDLGKTQVCTEVNDQIDYYFGDPILQRCWTVETDSVEKADFRLFFSDFEFNELAMAVGYDYGADLLYTYSLYVNIYPMDYSTMTFSTEPYQLDYGSFTVTEFDKENGVWSLELYGMNNAKIELLSYRNTLPLTLLSFEGEPKKDHNFLYWITASEQGTDYFVIEKSRTGSQFDSIGIVDVGNNKYDFEDWYPSTGDNYYRLKIMDSDGTFQYSHIIRLSNKGSFNINIINNPFTQRLFVEILNPKAVNTTVAIIGVGGQIYYSSDHKISPSVYNLELDLDYLNSGNYIIRVQNMETLEVISRKIVKI